jgi:hypothetical protein
MRRLRAAPALPAGRQGTGSPRSKHVDLHDVRVVRSKVRNTTVKSRPVPRSRGVQEELEEERCGGSRQPCVQLAAAGGR